jgi:GWxTD domain-containing protein
MWKVCLACVLIVWSAAVAAPKGTDAPVPNPSVSKGDGPQFRCQLGQRLGSNPDSLRMVVSVSLPYDNLVFLRADSVFTSSFELVTTVFKDSSGLYTERISDNTVTAKSFSETNSRSQNATHVEEFLIPPGEYRVRVTLTTDKESPRKSRWEGKLNLPPSDPLLRLSDIYWESEELAAGITGLPNVIQSFTAADTVAHARAEIFSIGKATVRVMWSVLGQKGDTVRTTVSNLTPNGTVQTVDYTLDLKGLSPQKYTLALDADGNGRRETRTRLFSVHVAGIPVSITDLDLAIRQLKYVATSDQMKKFRISTPAQREKLFRDFWNAEAATRNMNEQDLMEEYYSRVQYANDHFSTNRAGWETDRGRIYVTYGEPTDIERHPFELNSRPYEIWFYASISKRFVFVDYTGFGDYTLVTPEWGY